MIDYQTVKNWNFGEVVHAYTQRDAMLYALGVGLGADPLDEGQLRYVFERDLAVVPTMASVLGTPGFWWKDPRTGADWVKIVHGEQSVELFKPLPPAATLVARNRVVSITDKGAGKGAICAIERELFDQASGERLARGLSVSFLRGDGGYSANGGPSDPAPEALPGVPERAPDYEVEFPTLERQALIYRLSGDYNVIHADPAVAKAAGFSRPLLHGLCTYGMAAHAVLTSVCGYDATRIRKLAVRFTMPVFPGETVKFELWSGGGNRLHLRARVPARDAIVLNNGLIELS